MSTVLLTWNPDRFSWPDLYNNISEIDRKGYCQDTWNCRAHNQVMPGDRVFLMRQGKEPKGIVASGVVDSRAFLDEHWETARKKDWYVRIKWNVLMDPKSEFVLSRSALNQGILKKMNWDSRFSGQIIAPDIARELETRWEAVVRNAKFSMSCGKSVRYWRMAMRAGDRGEDMWPVCKKMGVAAITYQALQFTDLNEYPKHKPGHKWNKLQPTQHASLSRVAYEMKKGDVIYVKDGTSIVGRGVVTGPYQFCGKSAIRTKDYGPWCHTVPVDWDDNFEPINVKLGSEPSTVLELKGERLQRLLTVIGVKEAYSDSVYESNDYYIEGAEIKLIQTSRERNPELKKAAVRKYGRNCMVCGFNFNGRYGADLGEGYIEVHHTKPLSNARGERKTSISDVITVCSNCHRMLHRSQGKTMKWQDLKKKLF